MNTTHTPGPWKHDRMFLGNAKDRRTGFIVNGPDMEPLPIRICDIRCSPESPFAVSKANARLIASAPDLLAALERFLSAVSVAEELEEIQAGTFEETSEQARAAIAKAKGESK